MHGYGSGEVLAWNAGGQVRIVVQLPVVGHTKQQQLTDVAWVVLIAQTTRKLA
jgi:hypothetical protein